MEIYTFNNGIKNIKDLTKDDIIYDGEKETKIDIVKQYKRTVMLCIYKTRPLKLSYERKVLTIKNIDDVPVWKNVNELTVMDFVAITTKELSIEESDDEYRYMLMGIYISCGYIEDNKLVFNITSRQTYIDLPLIQPNDNQPNINQPNDIELIENIMFKLFGIKGEVYKQSIKYNLNNELIEFVNSIEYNILTLRNYNDLHGFILGLHIKNKFSKFNLYAIMKDNETANKYYHILRNYGMDIDIYDNLLEFNRIFACSLLLWNPNDPVGIPSPFIISCFYTKNCYHVKNTFLKVMGIFDSVEITETYEAEKYKAETYEAEKYEAVKYNLDNVLIK
jgi:hypothetical protein